MYFIMIGLLYILLINRLLINVIWAWLAGGEGEPNWGRNPTGILKSFDPLLMANSNFCLNLSTIHPKQRLEGKMNHEKGKKCVYLLSSIACIDGNGM